MSENDPLRLYTAFREAMIEWVDENAFRFVRPSREHWPEGVKSRKEASEYYGGKAADEIIENMDEILVERAEREGPFDDGGEIER